MIPYGNTINSYSGRNIHIRLKVYISKKWLIISFLPFCEEDFPSCGNNRPQALFNTTDLEFVF